MKLDGEYLFDAPRPAVWEALFDPEVLAAVMPGTDKLEVDGNEYTGEINVKVGPVQGRFDTKIEVSDIDEPNSYTLSINGRGSTGFVSATALVMLTEEGTGTRMSYTSEAQVGGRVASVGQRLIDATARAIAKQSLDGLNANVQARTAFYAEQAAAQTEAPAAPEPEPVPEPPAPAADAAPPAPAPSSAASADAPSNPFGLPTPGVAPIVDAPMPGLDEDLADAVTEEAAFAAMEDVPEPQAFVSATADAPAVAPSAMLDPEETMPVPEPGTPVDDFTSGSLPELSPPPNPFGAPTPLEPTPVPEPEPVAAAEPVPAPDPTPVPEPEPAPPPPAPPQTATPPTVEAAAPAPSPAAAKPPVVKTDDAAFVAGVAKEVSRSLIPAPVMYGLVFLVLAAAGGGAYWLTYMQ